MHLESFTKRMVEGLKNSKDGAISVWNPSLVTKAEGEKYRKGLHDELPNAFKYNGKMHFWSFDLTTVCNRECPGCYVARGREIDCNATKKVPLQEYKGDLEKWEEWGDKNPTNKKLLEDAKKHINSLGGIRMFSAADYPKAEEMKHIFSAYDIPFDKNYFKYNVKAFLDDAHKYGWHVKAITKEINFLKDHIDHPALKGVDVSMNAHGFGESHDSLKKLRSGTHESATPEENAKLKKHKDKIIGRTVTYTPWDLKVLLDHKADPSHVGVITSAHEIPGNGIRYNQSIPKDPLSARTIFVQTNFPEELKYILNGSKPATPETLLVGLEKYVDKYNKVRDDIKAQIDKGVVNVNTLKDTSKPKSVTEAEESDDSPEKDVDNTEDTKTPDKEKHSVETTLRKVNGKWVEEKTFSRNGETKTFTPRIELDNFDKVNPYFDYKFTTEDAKFLMKFLENKMCCIGNKCHSCTAKCGVNPKTGKSTCDDKPIVKESFIEFINELAKKKFIIEDYEDSTVCLNYLN